MFTNIRVVILGAIFACLAASAAWAQSTSTIQGTVSDSSGSVLANASVVVQNQATAEERVTQTDSNGHYSVPSLPVGAYRITVKSQGMQTAIVNNLVLEVARAVEQDFKLKVASVETTIEIVGAAPVIESTTVGVGQVVNQDTVQQIPLNGRHFLDLGLLVAGSVTPPQNGFLSAPLRGQGSFAFNTAGNREDTTNIMINGINLNDQLQNQLTFQPSINTVQEFKVDNQTYSAEYGRNSGAIVNVATRSGSNAIHGEVFEFVRNHAFDARNFFNKEFTIPDPTQPTVHQHQRQSPFKRNNFGAAVGGPIWKDHTFYFLSYEALRQRQGIDTNATVPSAAQRATVTNPAIQQLLTVIPQPNSGANFISSTTAPVDIDQGTADISHTFSANDRLHGYYALQQDLRGEPTASGLNGAIPGFGDIRQSRRQIFTLNETHVFNDHVVNEARLGGNRIHITFTPTPALNPTSFAINNGINAAVGLPNIVVNGTVPLNFGGPLNEPQGRGDTTAVLSDSVSWLHGNHSFKFGGEFRRFLNDNFTGDTSRFTFKNMNDFLLGNANGFQVTQGNRASRITTNSVGLFAMDSYKVLPYLTLELGVRYDWNGTPTEARDRFVVFDPATSSLLQVGHGIGEVYNQNDKNFEPRVGFAWDLFHDGKTILRSAYGYNVDQPVTNSVTALASNPPLANPLAFSATTAKPTVPITSAFTSVSGSGLAPASINHNFKNAYVQEWNLNIQQQVTSTTGIMVGYFGSKGTHLRVPRNLNQRLTPNGARPFPTLASSQTEPCIPVAPALTCPIGNINEIDSATNSNYNALWVTGTQRLSHGLEFNASYTWSKSLDYNSLTSINGFALEDSTHPRLDYGPSDFDARHRFVISALYQLPFHGNRFFEGWEVSPIVSLQSGSPVNVVTANNTITGTNTIRPDLLGPIGVANHIITDVSTGNAGFVQWFTGNGKATVCDAAPLTLTPVTPSCLLFVQSDHFGNMRRNSLLGPDFKNLDFSVIKNTKITERVTAELRAEFFDLFNHPNLGSPLSGQNAVATPGSLFGVISNTRFPTGDSGSARQIQFAVKFKF